MNEKEIRTEIAQLIFKAQNHTNMFDGENLSFYEPLAETYRNKAYNAADAILNSGLVRKV